ncbi:MAG TPA: hypothetical protein VF018_03460 [Acidobacteriaceae bacterium]
MLLVESLPEFSRELTKLLITAGETALAAQVDRLEIVAKCDCNDDFCASFYTARKPFERYGKQRRTLEVQPAQGMILLDLIDTTIVHIEVLYRDDVRSKLVPLSLESFR